MIWIVTHNIDKKTSINYLSPLVVLMNQMCRNEFKKFVLSLMDGFSYFHLAKRTAKD